MWALDYNIFIVTPHKSWFASYADVLVNKLKELKFCAKRVNSHVNVPQGVIAIYLSYPKLVPLENIQDTYQSLVVHASRLPQGKGFSPWVWQILEGKNEIPVCLLEIVEKLDSGKILQEQVLKLNGTELLVEIRRKLSELIIDMILKYLTLKEQPEGYQQEGEETFYKKRSAGDSILDINQSIAQQINLLRVVDNEEYPAFFHYLGKKYILKIEVVNE